MSLITDKNIKVFDLSSIKRGDALRIVRKGQGRNQMSTAPGSARNGLILEVTEYMLKLIYVNIQNNAVSYLQISASEIEDGMWDITSAVMPR